MQKEKAQKLVGKNIWSYVIVPHATKILQNFWLNLVLLLLYLFMFFQEDLIMGVWQF